MADKERLHSLGRSEAAVHQRNAQLKNWTTSETNKQPDYILASRKSPRVKFDDSVVFLAAAQSGDLEEVERLVTEEGADVNSINKDGLTALHQCCIDDDFEMVQKLVKLGARIDVQDNEGWTPLHAAASCGHDHIVRYLLDKGAFPSPVNNEGDTPYDIAEDYETIQEMLEDQVKVQGVDVDAVRNQEELVMLEDANKLVNDPTMSMLISNGGATPLHIAAAKNYEKVVDVLLSLRSSQIDIDAEDDDGWTALHAAVYWGNMEVAEELVMHGASVNQKTKLGESIDDLCDPEMIDQLEALRKSSEEHNNRHRRNAMPSGRTHNRPSVSHQHSREDVNKPSPQIKRRPSRERSMFPKLDMAKEKEDLEKWQTETTESITNTIMADSSGKRGDTTTKKWQSAESSENVTNAMMTGASSSNKTVEVAVPASENIGPASGVIDNQTVAEARDMAVEDTNSSKEALNHAKESVPQNSAVMDSPPLSQSNSETTSSNESISARKTVAGKLISSPKCVPPEQGYSLASGLPVEDEPAELTPARKRPGMSPQMMKRVGLWESQSTTSTPTPTTASVTNSVATTPTPIASSTPSSSSGGSVSSASITTNDHSPNTTIASSTKRFSFQPRTIPQEPSVSRIPRSSSVDQRPSSAKANLSSIGKRSTLNTESRAEKRVSYDETRLKKQLTLPENSAGYKTSSLPRGAKIGNSTDGSMTENTERPRKTDGNVSSEGAATTNSITAEESSMSPSARNLSREISDESEARRRSRARRTRQSRQATQPVPADVLDRIKKHDEEMSKSEDSSGSSSTSSTPPRQRKEEEERAKPTMSVFRPAARPTPKNKVLNPPSSHQTLWTSSRKKETSGPPSTTTVSSTAASTVTEPTPKEKEPDPKPQPIPTPSNTSSVATNGSRAEPDISIDVTDYSSMADNSDDRLSQSRSRATSVARRRPREKRKATGINFVPEENEDLPDNLKDIFGKKSSLSESSIISDHSAQSSISEPDDGLPNEELTRVLGLLSEEQAKSRSLQEKVESLEKQLDKKQEVEKELEKAKGKVSELNRRFQDATRAYEQEKRDKEQKEARITELESGSKNLQDLKNENQRLKDENSALIRVIGKLSRAPTHQHT